MKFLIWAAPLAIVLAAAADFASRGSAPAGQRAFQELDGAAFDSLRTEFNQSLDRTRVILLLSQSCPYCLKGAAKIQDVLDRHKDTPLAVYVIWQPILPTDWSRPGSHVLARLHDSRVQQYFDGGHRVAALLGKMSADQQLDPECCWSRGLPWDLLAVYEPGMEWHNSLPSPALFKGTVEDAAPEFETLLARR